MSRPTLLVRTDFKAWKTFTMRWSDNDVYGHVNNTIYYQWFDTAVNSWMIERGLLDLAKGDPIGLVVETRCTYHSPLAFPGVVDVGLAVAQLGRSSIRYSIGVFGEASKRIAAQGEFVHVVVDRQSRRPVDIPAGWRRELAAIS